MAALDALGRPRRGHAHLPVDMLMFRATAGLYVLTIIAIVVALCVGLDTLSTPAAGTAATPSTPSEVTPHAY